MTGSIAGLASTAAAPGARVFGSVNLVGFNNPLSMRTVVNGVQSGVTYSASGAGDRNFDLAFFPVPGQSVCVEANTYGLWSEIGCVSLATINASAVNASSATVTGTVNLATSDSAVEVRAVVDGIVHVTSLSATGNGPRSFATAYAAIAGQTVCVEANSYGYWVRSNPCLVALTATPPPSSTGGMFTPLNPLRILDTRNAVGSATRRLVADETLAFQVAGVGGVPNGATAAVMNVTVSGPVASGYFTVYPCDAVRPDASNLNFVAGQTVPNLVSVRLSSTGKVCVYTNASAFAIVDVAGYYSEVGDRFVSLAPGRILDSRNGIGVAKRTVVAGEVVMLQVSGRGGVSSATSGAVLNVTVTNASSGGYVTVFPCDQAQPVVSNLNFEAGSTVANLVYARLDAQGRACLYTNAATDLIADVSGYFSATGSIHSPLVPLRVFDTRNGIGTSAGARVKIGAKRNSGCFDCRSCGSGGECKRGRVERNGDQPRRRRLSDGVSVRLSSTGRFEYQFRFRKERGESCCRAAFE